MLSKSVAGEDLELTLVHGLSSCPGKETGEGVGPQEDLHLVRLLLSGHPVPVVAVRHHMELSVSVACWIW